jgi:hypothetical protein
MGGSEEGSRAASEMTPMRTLSSASGGLRALLLAILGVVAQGCGSEASVESISGEHTLDVARLARSMESDVEERIRRLPGGASPDAVSNLRAASEELMASTRKFAQLRPRLQLRPTGDFEVVAYPWVTRREGTFRGTWSTKDDLLTLLEAGLPDSGVRQSRSCTLRKEGRSWVAVDGFFGSHRGLDVVFVPPE